MRREDVMRNSYCVIRNLSEMFTSSGEGRKRSEYRIRNTPGVIQHTLIMLTKLNRGRKWQRNFNGSRTNFKI